MIWLHVSKSGLLNLEKAVKTALNVGGTFRGLGMFVHLGSLYIMQDHSQLKFGIAKEKKI